MNKKQKLISLAGTVLIAVLLAAPAVAAGASALGLGSGGMLPAYLLSLLAAFTALMVVGRLISGVHWLSDIIGSILLSAGLVLLYAGCQNRLTA